MPSDPWPTSEKAFAAVWKASCFITDRIENRRPHRDDAARHTSHTYEQNWYVSCMFDQSSVSPCMTAPDAISSNGSMPPFTMFPPNTSSMPTFAVMRIPGATARAASETARNSRRINSVR